MSDPTVAEAVIARMIAHHHGSAHLYRNREGSMVTVASRSGSGTGWYWEVDNYVERHWKEYLGAARAMIEMRQ